MRECGKQNHHSGLRAFRGFRGFLPFFAVLAPFAVLLAAATAPAQSPAILLDIKSPATASPPNESLLTLDEEGNLWIKGHLYDCPFQSTITLDPAKKYWTLRDAAGKIVWALEVHSPATGISTGDLYSIGFLRSWSSNPNQPNSLARYFNSSGQVVFSVDTGGNGLSAGITPAAEPPKTQWESMSPSLDGYVVPEPFPQGRIYCWRPGGVFDNPTLMSHDVSGMKWRLRYDPSKGLCSLIDYGVCWGFRYWFSLEPQGQMTYMVFSYNPNTQTWGSGGPYGGEVDALLYLGTDSKIHPNYSNSPPDSTWSVSAFPTVPADRSKPIPISLTMTDQPPAAPDPPTQGNLTDSCGATADSLLYLYDVDFATRPLPTAIPRNDGDPAVAVGCRLRPQNTPGSSYMELILWDPACLDYYGFPLFMKIISSGSSSISQSWDGKLYLDGDEYSFDEYTQASDIFMSAVVYWNRSNPPKPWETELDAFDESRYAIIASDGTQPVSSCRTNFAWITAGDATTPPSMPALSARLAVNGTAALPANANWHLVITYNRPDRNDSDSYPTGTPGYTTVPGTQAWNVNFGADFRGGKVTMTSAFGGQSVDHVFHIRGYNPSVTALETYLSNPAVCGVHWYALNIARQESSLYQFNPASEQNPLPGPNELTDLVAQPRRGSAIPYGWGLFQLTDPRPESQALWNWNENTARAIELLAEKRTIAETYINGQRNLALIDPDTNGQIPPYTNHPYGNVTFGEPQESPKVYPPLDAQTVRENNPGAGPSVINWDPDENTWHWNANSYVTSVFD